MDHPRLVFLFEAVQRLTEQNTVTEELLSRKSCCISSSPPQGSARCASPSRTDPTLSGGRAASPLAVGEGVIFLGQQRATSPIWRRRFRGATQHPKTQET